MPVHVLHVIPDLGIGGAPRWLLDLVGNTSRAACRYTVCYLRPPHEHAERIERVGVPVIYLDAGGRKSWLRVARAIAGLVRERDVDVVHSQMFDANVGARLSRLFGMRRPLVSQIISLEYEPESIAAGGWSPRRVEALRLLDEATSRLARPHYVAVSRAVEESTRRRLHVPRDRIRTIYNSVDPATLATTPDEVARLRRAHDIPDGAFVYVNVGRQDRPKGQEILLRAFARIAAAQPGSLLALAGIGSATPELQRLTDELGVRRQVRHVGQLPTIGAFLGLAGAFVFPSRIEGLPLALVEAMFQGVPCIASSIGPHREVLDEGRAGLLVPPGDEAALAGAMTRLHADPGLAASLVAAARIVAERRFATRVIMPTWEAFYREIAREAGET